MDAYLSWFGEGGQQQGGRPCVGLAALCACESSELCGTLSPPPCVSGGGNIDLGTWRGRLWLACTTNVELGMWELASYGGADAAVRWDAVHWRSWRTISGVVVVTELPS